jgi:hypothetical protein
MGTASYVWIRLKRFGVVTANPPSFPRSRSHTNRSALHTAPQHPNRTQFHTHGTLLASRFDTLCRSAAGVPSADAVHVLGRGREMWSSIKEMKMEGVELEPIQGSHSIGGTFCRHDLWSAIRRKLNQPMGEVKSTFVAEILHCPRQNLCCAVNCRHQLIGRHTTGTELTRTFFAVNWINQQAAATSQVYYLSFNL